MTVSHFHLSETLLQPPINSTLLIASVWIINHIYAGFTNSLIFSLWSRTAAGDSSQSELLSEILTSVRDTELTYVIENSDDVQCGDVSTGRNSSISLSSNQCILRENVLLMVDSFESFMLFKRQLVKRNFLIAGFYTILYTPREQHYYDTILNMFNELFDIYVTNVNIFVELSQETLVYSYYPFTQYHCHAVTPVIHNRFTIHDGFIYDKPFFPRKTVNFYGCLITVATWNGPPFIFFGKTSKGETLIRGIEGSLIRTLALRMNFTIKILETSSRGMVLKNMTATEGAVKSIMAGAANMTINTYVYAKLSLKAMLAAYTYISYPVVVAVPQGYPLTPFERLMRPFKYIIWSCLSSSVLAGITIIFFIKFLRRRTISDFVFGTFNSMPFTNLLSVFFGGPVTILPRRNFARYVLLVWLIYTFILRSAYTSELFILLQDSRWRTNLKTIEEMIEKNFTLLCPENILGIILQSTDSRRIKIMEGQPYGYLAELHDSEVKQAVILLRPFLLSYNRMIRGIPPIRALPGNLLTVPITMYFRRSSYLLDVVNEHLLAFMASGLTEIWSSYFLPDEEVMNDQIGEVPAVLSVQLLMGVFSVYLFLMAVCILIFGLEMWSKCSPICQSVVNFLNF